jgi:hypothetical protein
MTKEFQVNEFNMSVQLLKLTIELKLYDYSYARFTVLEDLLF